MLFLFVSIPSVAQVPNGYDFRKTVQINGSSEIPGNQALSNFPILFKVTAEEFKSVSNGGYVTNTDGYDIIFASKDSAQVFDHELESYDPVTGEVVAWVRMPSLQGGTDDTLAVHFGNSNVNSDPSTEGTWNSGYQLVQHMNSGFLDATARNNDGTDNGTSDAPGIIRRSRSFDGSNDYVEIADDPTLDISDNISISMWVYIESFDTINSPTLLTKGTSNRNYWAFFENDRTVTFRYAPSGGFFGSNETNSSTSLNTQQWYYLTFNFQYSFVRDIYINGTRDGREYSFGGNVQTNGQPVTISEESLPFEGQIDEVRISNSARSANWITTEYNNQSDPSAFLTLINTPPELSNIESTTLEYKTGADPSAVTDNLQVSDTDGNEITGATVSITSNYVASEDILYFTDQNGLNHSWNNSTGVLTLSGSATVQEYNQALHSVTYENTNNTNPSAATRTLSITVSDPDNSSNTVTRDLTVIPPNQPPVLSGIESSTLDYIEGDGKVSVTSNISVSDSDNTDLNTATVQITDNYIQGEDQLEFTNANGITSSWDVGSGTLTLTGSASVADYQSALGSVTYKNVSPVPNTSTRTVQFQVSDEEDASNTLSRDISVTETNDLPVVANIESTRLQVQGGDPPQSISNTLTVSDADDPNIEGATVQVSNNYIQSEDELGFSDILGINGSWNNSTGTLTLSGTASKSNYQTALRSVTYDNTSATPSSATRTVSFSVTDGNATSTAATREISLSAVQSISGLQLWLKADAGVTTNGSNRVTSWADQSGNNRNFSSSGGSRPRFNSSDQNVADLNNQAAINFAGNGDFLEDSDGESYINGNTEFTLFYVIQSDQTNSDRGFFDTQTPNTTDDVLALRYDEEGVQGSATNLIKAGILNDVGDNKLESFSDIQTTQGQILSLDWQSGQEYNLVVDGVLNNPSAISQPPSGTINSANTVIVGKGPKDAPDTPGRSWDGYIAEVILFDRFLPVSERQAVEDYLSEKYDIAIRLIGKAKGGENISADTYASGTYTNLTGPRIREDFRGELKSGETITFKVPDGFEWDTGGSTPSVSTQPAYGNNTDLNISYTSRTPSEIIFTVNQQSDGSKPGEAVFSNLRIRPTTGQLPNQGTITNVGTTGPGGTTNYGDIVMIPGQANSISYAQQPTNNPVDQSISPAIEVQVVDQFGNSVKDAGRSITMSLTSGVGTLSGTKTQTTNITGTTYFNDLTINQTGTKQLTANSSGLPDVASNNFEITDPGALTSFEIEKVSGGIIPPQTAGVPFEIKITAIDGTGSVDSDFSGTVDITSNGILSQGAGTTANFQNGVSNNYTIEYNNVGEFTIIATNSDGPENGRSNEFEVNPGPADKNTSTITASPTFIDSDGSSTSTITVQLKDSEGNNLTTGGANISLNTNAGSLDNTTPTDNGDGTYTAVLTSSSSNTTATISGTLNGETIADNATVTFTSFDAIWRGTPGGDASAEQWDNPQNWSPTGVPGSNASVLVPANPSNGTRFPVIQNANQTIGTLVVESGADVTVSSGQTLTISGSITGDGEINGSNTSTVEIGGNLSLTNLQLGNVIFNGDDLQQIENIQQFNNLEINNDQNVEVSDNLQVSGTLTLTSGNLIIPSGKSLIANDQNVTNGALTFRRRLGGMPGWRMISSPVASTYGDLLSGTLTQGYTGSDLGLTDTNGNSLQPNVLWYVESYEGTDNQRWRTPTDASDPLTGSRGLFVYVFGDVDSDSRYNEQLPDTLEVTGPEFTGNGNQIDFGITYTATADTGWNLVGNPYGASLNWDDNTTWTKTNVNQTIYVWDPNANAGNGNFLTWNGSVGSLGSGLIAPFQGFWVKANGTNPQLTVSEDNKVIGGIFRRKEQNKTPNPNIKFELQAEDIHGLYQESFVMFSNNAKRNFDPQDGYRMFPFGQTYLELYFKQNDGSQMAIEHLPNEFEYQYERPLSVGAIVDGNPVNSTLTLSWPTMENLPADWIIKLRDNETDEEINLRNRSFYSFRIQNQGKAKQKSQMAKSYNTTPDNPIMLLDPSKYQPEVKGKSKAGNSRFTLIITTQEIQSEIPEKFQLQQNYPNPFNPSTKIEFGLPKKSNVTVEIYDILGRLVQRLVNDEAYPAGTHTLTWTPNNLASGVYLYRVRTENKAISKKMTFIK